MFNSLTFKLIRAYQYIVSPFLGKHCRFYPSCSEYVYLSVKKHGAARGWLKGGQRLLKCHPWNAGGVDLP